LDTPRFRAKKRLKTGDFLFICLFSVRRLPVRAIVFAGGFRHRYNPGPQGGFFVNLPPFD
jgi:hypothetical protein